MGLILKSVYTRKVYIVVIIKIQYNVVDTTLIISQQNVYINYFIECRKIQPRTPHDMTIVPTLNWGRAHCAVDCIEGSAQPRDQVRHIKQVYHPDVQHARTAHEDQICSLRMCF